MMLTELWALILYLTIILLLIFSNILKIGRLKEKLIKSQSFLIIYISFSTVLFLILKKSDSVIVANNINYIFDKEYQIFFLVMIVTCIIQFVFVISIRSVFYKMVLVGILNIMCSVMVLYYVGFGIISAVWFLIYTGILCAYLLVISIFDSLIPVIESAKKNENLEEKKMILDLVREELNKYLKIGFQGIFALGASIGVSMSILFKEGESAWHNQVYLVNAVSMVYAFGSVCLGVIIWIVKPYLDNFTNVRFYYEKGLNNKKDIILM